MRGVEWQGGLAAPWQGTGQRAGYIVPERARLSVPPLAAKRRGTALYCSRNTETSRMGGGCKSERHSLGCGGHSFELLCSQSASQSATTALPPGLNGGLRGAKCPDLPLVRTYNTQLQT